MSNFFGLDFVFNSIPSQMYGLKIVNFDSGGLYGGAGSSNVTLYTQTVLRREKSYYLGRSQNEPLQFPLTFASSCAITGMERSAISNWLFGETNYRKLMIIQDDLNGAWFNCFLTRPVPYYIGNVNYGFTTTVVCDSPFAYSPLKTLTRTYEGNNVITDDITIYNGSANHDYLYPNVSFELNTVGNSFSIINYDDDDRNFLFTGLLPEEEISINGDTQAVVSSTGLKRLNNFNKNWLRLVPKVNRLRVESGIGTFTITYYERIKIGA
jgi:hypothetical protein